MMRNNINYDWNFIVNLYRVILAVICKSISRLWRYDYCEGMIIICAGY